MEPHARSPFTSAAAGRFSHDTIAGDISDYEDAVLDPNDDVFERSPVTRRRSRVQFAPMLLFLTIYGGGV
jgi:hypothetical protein